MSTNNKCLNQKNQLRNMQLDCGVCKKDFHVLDIWYPWISVSCDDCTIWMHTECANISSKQSKNKEAIKCYYCPECKANSTQLALLPDTVDVVCNGFEGTCFISHEKVQCNCHKCVRKQPPCKFQEWESHTGSKAKKWKSSIKIKDSKLPLSKWLEDFKAHGFDPLKFDKELLHSFLQRTYEPVSAKWTTENCAVCRGHEDWDYNKIIICNRCEIAVYQECYGMNHLSDSTKWVCRACETPDIDRECCLCPVKGGALKPSDIDNLWVHVTCAWLQPEMEFPDVDKMEPAQGLLRICPVSFVKECVICKQVHGSCVKCCCKCDTYFHVMCAAKEGYALEVHSSVKTGTRCKVYCKEHRDVNPNNAVVLKTSKMVKSSRKLLEKHNREYGLRLVSPKRLQLDPLSAARCCVFERSNKKSGISEPIIHRLMGPHHHSLKAIEDLNSYNDEALKPISTFKEQLEHVQRTEKYQVCFGKSGIHGWGLFAHRSIKEGEEIMEYRGEVVTQSVSDLSKARYHREGKDYYFFKISEDAIFDATHKGNIARLLNHSCMANCYGRIVIVREGDHRLVIIAKNDIAVGEELTYDYRFDPEEQKVPCLCRAPTCQRFMN